MTTDEFSRLLLQELHPQPYDTPIPECRPFDLLLTRGSALPGGTNAFAFLRVPSGEISEVYRQARSEARRLTKSMWLFHEVGLYLVLCGPEALWRDKVEEAPVDATGLHQIIVQAVHFVDPATGSNHLRQSKWGPVTFGGTDSMSDKVKAVIERASIER